MVGSHGIEPCPKLSKSLVQPIHHKPILKMVGDVRIELTLRASETPVLPLYESPIKSTSLTSKTYRDLPGTAFYH
jgi:hypothetical protein